METYLDHIGNQTPNRTSSFLVANKAGCEYLTQRTITKSQNYELQVTKL